MEERTTESYVKNSDGSYVESTAANNHPIYITVDVKDDKGIVTKEIVQKKNSAGQPLCLFERYNLYELPAVEIINGQLQNSLTSFVMDEKEDESQNK